MRTSERYLIFSFIYTSILCLPFLAIGQNNQKRDRGESFYRCESSNTSGPGNIWVSFTGLGLVWDNPPSEDTANNIKHRWISNVRGFPEAKIQAGITDFLTLNLESRMLSWGFKPGWVTTGLKLTIPNNKELRLNGFGADIKYRYQFIESAPTLGGYIGFMPEGFVTKGSSIDANFLYELDLLARFTNLPLRLLFNGGIRIPLREDKLQMMQMLTDAGLVYNGYGYDFFVIYSGEFFNNFFSPFIIDQNGKKFGVFFSENPMYLTIGGDVRYENGLVLSLSVPILVSTNYGSNMKDLSRLNQQDPTFQEELDFRITDPFDPWFVKWKIEVSASYPIRFKMSSAEMMRNFLLVKNRKKGKKIDIDSRLQGIEQNDNKKDQDDAMKRLEEIKKRREQSTKEQN
jgi:hypothetical protein